RYRAGAAAAVSIAVPAFAPVSGCDEEQPAKTMTAAGIMIVDFHDLRTPTSLFAISIQELSRTRRRRGYSRRRSIAAGFPAAAIRPGVRTRKGTTRAARPRRSTCR